MLTKEESKMVEENIGLAYDRADKLYKQYQYRLTRVNTPLEDVKGEAILGLIRAVQKFDPSKGFKFSTYAVPHIDNKVRRCVVKNNCILKLPRNDQTHYGIHKNNIELLRMCVSGSNVLDIQSPVTGSDGENKELLLIDVLENKFDMLYEELLILIDQILTNREFKIFHNYYVLDQVQEEIAMDLRMSQVQVSRLLKKIRLKVKKSIRENMI